MTVQRDWRRPHRAESWQLWWSDAGDFGQVHPRPEAGDVSEFYTIADYYTHDPNTAESGPPGFLDRLRVALASRLDRGVHPDAAFWASVVPAGARTALEIGSGNGDRLVELAPLVEGIWGVEPDPAACAASRAKGLTVHAGTAEDMPAEITAQRYDFILFTHVLEHCLDPMKALKNAANLLSARGVMVLETPNNHALGLTQQGQDWYWLDVPRHLNFFTEASLRAFARQAGLDVQDCQYWGYCRQFLGSWLEAQARIAAVMAGQAASPKFMARQRRQSWVLLARTAWAAREAKYDSVRLICRRA